MAMLAVFAAIVAYGVTILPGGWNGDASLNASLAFICFVWVMGFGTRMFSPGSKLAGLIETLCIFAMLSLFAALAASVLAIGGGAYIDDTLVALDKALFPFFDWRSFTLNLPEYPRLYTALSYIYASLNWQPFAFLVLVLFFGSLRDMEGLVSVWALGMAGCILPFHFLPAKSPYIHYGISREDMPGSLVALPWDFLPKFEGMRSGAIDSIGMDNLTGMVTIPSFHACAAVLLSWCWWRFRLLRWPFVLLNIGMALAAVPIGGHYVIDIVAGAAVAIVAIALVNAYFARRDRSSARRTANRDGSANLTNEGLVPAG
ncbi:hypothetical protein BMF35_a2114 [Aurantiacibacter gangjinensis]|nr:hypothetical protein BMF35_a2114 [Aurantiacibacter gangjinensis]